jgi:hypothetical protein
MTPKENKIDAIKQGLFTPLAGAKNPNAIYTEKQIRDVCKCLEENKLEVEDIVAKTGVSKITIADVALKYRWKSVSCDYKIENYTKLPINTNKTHSIDQIIKVCELLEEGTHSTKEIMILANVSNDCVKRVRAGKTFTDISSKYSFVKKKNK